MYDGSRIFYNTAQQSDTLYVYEIGHHDTSADMRTKTRFFDCNTFHFVVDGKGEFDGQPLTKGMGFFVKKGHMATYKPDSSDPWKYYWINFDGAAGDEVINELGYTQDKMVFKYTDIGNISKTFEEIVSGENPGNESALMICSYFYRIMNILEKSDDKELRSFEKLSPPEKHFKNAIRFISIYYYKKISIEDVARSENIERHYLNMLFKKYSDMSPKEYLEHIRMDKAKSLLRSTDYPIGEIALSVGYDDILQFSRAFRKKVGISPSGFRESGNK